MFLFHFFKNPIFKELLPLMVRKCVQSVASHFFPHSYDVTLAAAIRVRLFVLWKVSASLSKHLSLISQLHVAVVVVVLCLLGSVATRSNVFLNWSARHRSRLRDFQEVSLQRSSFFLLRPSCSDISTAARRLHCLAKWVTAGFILRLDLWKSGVPPAGFDGKHICADLSLTAH